VYLAIGVAALALVLLIAGVVIWREEVFGGAVATGQDGQRDLATGKPDRGAVSSPEQDAVRELPAGADTGGQLAASGASRGRAAGRSVASQARASESELTGTAVAGTAKSAAAAKSA